MLSSEGNLMGGKSAPKISYKRTLIFTFPSVYKREKSSIHLRGNFHEFTLVYTIMF